MRSDLAQLTAEPGSYALLLRNDAARSVTIGALGDIEFRPGFFVYVGSAFGPGGIRARVARHVRKSKRLHWHIDYLRRVLTLEEVWLTAAARRTEHAWATALGRRLTAVGRRFGASDCRCRSHLFYSPQRPSRSLLPSCTHWRPIHGSR